MPHESIKATEERILSLLEAEPNEDARKLGWEAYNAYLRRDVARINADQGKTKTILILIAYPIIVIPPMIAFMFKGWLIGSSVTIGCFVLVVVMMAVILKVNGDISEPGLLAMIKYSFRALFLFKKN